MTDTAKPESDPQFNLEHFLKNLSLEPLVHGKRAPPMPPPKARSTGMPLVMRPGGYRNLKNIETLDCLQRDATFFFSNFNAGKGDAIKDLKLTSQLSTQEVMKVFFSNPYEIEEDSAALFVIERSPIKSVQQLVQAINPELHDLKFYTPPRSGTINAQRIEPSYFCTVDGSGTIESVKCIIIALPPWDFAPQDFEDFSRMEKFEDGCTSRNDIESDPPWCNADRMWAYVHDLCFMNDCHHFVLTTYEQWAFGAFSTYYTTGFVSQTTPWDSKPSSVLELFTYWVLNACRTENTIMVDKVRHPLELNYHDEAVCMVPKEKHLDPDILEQVRLLCRKRFASDEHMGAGAVDTSPCKRARKDPLEDRTGWERLNLHADAQFWSRTCGGIATPEQLRASKSVATGSNREPWSDTEDDDGMLARPCPRWNKWRKGKRDSEDKENPHEPLGEHARNHKANGVAPKQVIPALFGHPIPCYSSDIDRDNGRYRPELVRFVSFPIPAPKL